MRNAPSGAENQSYRIMIPSGTTINPGNTWGSLLPIYGKPNDNIVANWDGASFGPRGPLQAEGNVTSTGQGQVYAWNFTAAPIVTGVDLFINVQLIPKE